MLIAAIITFIFGIIIGLNLKDGCMEKEAELQQLLTGAVAETDTLKSENQTLQAKLDGVGKDRDTGNKRNEEEQLIKTIRDKEAMKKQISGLRAELAKTGTKLKSGGASGKLVDSMNNRIAKLEKENQAMNQTIQEIRLLTRQEQPTPSDSLQ